MSSALKVQGEALLGAAAALGDTSRPDASISMSSLSLGSGGTNSQAGGAMGGESRGPTPIGVTTSGGLQGGGGSDEPSNPFLTSGVIQN